MLSGEPVAQASMCAADITMQSSCCCLLRWLRPFYSSLSSSCVQHQSNQPTPSPLSPRIREGNYKSWEKFPRGVQELNPRHWVGRSERFRGEPPTSSSETLVRGGLASLDLHLFTGFLPFFPVFGIARGIPST